MDDVGSFCLKPAVCRDVSIGLRFLLLPELDMTLLLLCFIRQNKGVARLLGDKHEEMLPFRGDLSSNILPK